MRAGAKGFPYKIQYGASFGATVGKFFALPSLLIGVDVAAVAFKGWRGVRHWWTWHAAMLAWVVVAPIAALLLLAGVGG